MWKLTDSQLKRRNCIERAKANTRRAPKRAVRECTSTLFSSSRSGSSRAFVSMEGRRRPGLPRESAGVSREGRRSALLGSITFQLSFEKTHTQLLKGLVISLLVGKCLFELTVVGYNISIFGGKSIFFVSYFCRSFLAPNMRVCFSICLIQLPVKLLYYSKIDR